MRLYSICKYVSCEVELYWWEDRVRYNDQNFIIKKFQVSCSYGPGRYDDNYENKGNDYPGYVRWTKAKF